MLSSATFHHFRFTFSLSFLSSPVYAVLTPPRFHPFRASTSVSAETPLHLFVEEDRSTLVFRIMKPAFEKYASYLNELNDKRERVVKASRDVVMNSKKVIFQVHRISKDNKEQVLEKAEKDLVAVTERYMSRLVNELQGTDFWKLRRAYSFGVQEYVEAATFCRFCRTGTLLNMEEINDTLLPLADPSHEPLRVNLLDYLLGVADLTGELMRLAIGRVSDGELEYATRICDFVREIYQGLAPLAPNMDDSHDMKTKMDTMLQSVIKIENACFSVHVRGSEFIPATGGDNSGFPAPHLPELLS